MHSEGAYFKIQHTSTKSYFIHIWTCSDYGQNTRYFEFLKWAPLESIENGHSVGRISLSFEGPSLSTEAVAKMDNFATRLNKSRWENTSPEPSLQKRHNFFLKFKSYLVFHSKGYIDRILDFGTLGCFCNNTPGSQVMNFPFKAVTKVHVTTLQLTHKIIQSM